MPLRHLAPTSTVDEVAGVLDDDGAVVIDDLAPAELLDDIAADLEPFVAATPYGDDFSGHHTRRTGGLVARAAGSRELVMHPLVTGAVGSVLGHATTFQLHLTQLIHIEPGQAAQMVHRDQWAFDFFSFPDGYEVTCNTIWALTDFTEENGATRVIPGSHRAADKLRFEGTDTEPAEMARGSVLLYTGALYHGGGANRSGAPRDGLNITYSVGWLRQEENQYLTVPADLARDLPDDLLRMLGYAPGAYALGYVDDLRDPLDALRGGPPGGSFGPEEVLHRG